MIGKVKIIEPGYFSTIQDRGRFGFAKHGVPFGGAMDQISYKWANVILNNNENDACIEWVFQPPVLRFSESTIISVTGAETTLFLNDKRVGMNQRIKISRNDVLTSKFCKNYKYGYVGIRNGFLSKEVLGSRSFFKGVTSSHMLKEGDQIQYRKVGKFTNQFSKVSSNSHFKNSNELLAYKGPEFDQLTDDKKHLLMNSSFTISGIANRMAIQLEELVPNDLPSMLTSPVLPGTVQLTPSGKLIVLMRDCQTTGGYPRVFQLSQEAINSIAQKRMKEICKFQLIAD